MSKNIFKIIIFILVLISPELFLIPIVKAENNPSNLDNYVEYFYNRYSKHFDQNGLIYSQPEYGILEPALPQKIREWISLISYYKYRAMAGDQNAKNIIRFGILNGYNELLNRGSKSQSFQEAEAHFLTIQILKKIPELLKRLLTAKDNVLTLKSFDNCGNISFGIHEYIDIPGTKYDPKIGIMGLQASVTLGRPGFRIGKRRIQTSKVGKTHKITKEEAIAFMKTNYNVIIKEEADLEE